MDHHQRDEDQRIYYYRDVTESVGLMQTVNCSEFNVGSKNKQKTNTVASRAGFRTGGLPKKRGSGAREKILKFVTLFLVLAGR
jgi:hypothetical protein